MTVGLLSFGAPPAGFNGGRSQTNLNFIQNAGEDPFLNRMKTSSGWGWQDNNTTDPITPDLFDSDGYPLSSALFTTHGGVKAANIFLPTTTELPGDWVLKWDGNGTLAISKTGGSVTTVSGSLTSSGGSGRYVYSQSAGGTYHVVSITATGTPGVTNVRLVHEDEEDLLDNGEIFSPKLLERLQTAKFGILRYLNWQSCNTTNATTWDTANRPTSYYSYFTSQYRSDFYSTSASATNSGSDYTGPAPSAWAVLANGVTVHYVWPASSPTSGALTFTSGGSPNITWTAHGLATGNQTLVTTTGALPAGLTASTLGVVTPSTKYFVAVVDPNTITLSATSGGPAINFTDTGSGTHTGRTCVTLDAGGTGAIPVLNEFSSHMTASGNSFPVGSKISTLTYNSTLGAWIKQGGTLANAGIDNAAPVSVLLALALKVRAHPWFCMPPQACTPMTDYATELATYVRNNSPSWMIPIFEPPNELWNTAGGFYQTTFAQTIGQFYGWGTNDIQNWYGRALSTLGQDVAAVYGVIKADVATQAEYYVVGGMQTSTANTPSGVAVNNPRLASTKYLLQTPQSGYAADPAEDWATHFCCANYFSPSWYGRNQEVRAALDYYNGTTSAVIPYEATDTDGFAVTITNGSPATFSKTDHGLFVGQICNVITTGSLGTGLSSGNAWVNSVINDDDFTLSSTDPYNGGATPINVSGTPSGVWVIPNGNSTIPFNIVAATNAAAWAAGFGVNKFTFYEGCWSPDYNTNSVTSTITAADNAAQCTFTMPTTTVQSIRSPTAQANQVNPACAVGQYLRLSAFTGNFTGFNNQVVQVTAVNGSDGRLVTVNLDTSAAGAFSGTGTATFVMDAAGAIPMSTALNNLRGAAKLTPAMQTHTTSLYNSLMGITGAEFPSNYLLGGPPGVYVWSILDPIYTTSTSYQYEAIKAFNA